jgi:hypothetical protein
MPVCCLLLSLGSAFPFAAQDLPAGRRQAEKSITFEVHAEPKEVLPLFGPVRESDWSPTWKPSFIYPAAGSNTREGTVFTTGSGNSRISVWILVEYSAQRKTVHYAVVSPDETTTEIWVRLSPRPGNRTKVQVTQRRTSLRVETDEFIAHFEQHFPSEAGHWQETIEGYLRSRANR